MAPPPESDAEIFVERFFPREVELQVVLEDLPIPELGTDSEAVFPSPQVIFYSSGETTPGSIEVRYRETQDLLWQIEWDLLGRFSVLLRGEPLEEEFDES